MEQKLTEFIHKLPEYFVPERSEGLSLISQLNLLNASIDYWTLKIEHNQCEIKHEKALHPQLELTASPNDLLAILSGEMDPTKAYMQGKIKLQGGILQALKLMELFSFPDEIIEKIKM